MKAVIVAAKLCTSLLYTFSLLLFALCCTGYIDAAEANNTDTPRFTPQFSLGLGAEANGSMREPVALGGMLHMDIRFARSFAAGIKGTYSLDFMKLPEYSFAEDTLIEGDVLFRWYALSKAWKPRGDKTGGETVIFLQAEAGVALGEAHFAWDDAFMPKSNIGELIIAPSGGIAAGVRFTFPNNLYLEPYGRFGYPYTWSGGIALGYTFRKKPQPTVQPVESTPQPTPKSVESIPPPPTLWPIAQQNPMPAASGELPDIPLVLRIWRETLVPIARPYPAPIAYQYPVLPGYVYPSPIYTPVYPPPEYGYPAPTARRYPVPVYPRVYPAPVRSR